MAFDIMLCKLQILLANIQKTICRYLCRVILIVSCSQGKGFAFIQFVIPEDARKALEQLDRHAFHGRLLHIIPARRQPGASGAEAFGNAARYFLVILCCRLPFCSACCNRASCGSMVGDVWRAR